MSKSLLNLLEEPRRRRLIRLLARVVASSALLAVMIALISAMIEVEIGSAASVSLGLAAVLGLAASYWLYRSGATGATIELEGAMTSLRVRLTDRIAAAGLRTVERAGDLRTAYTRDIEQIGAVAGMTVFFVQMTFMLLPGLVHVAVKSRFAIAVLAAAAAISVPRMYRAYQRSRERAQAAAREWSSFQTLLTKALDGFDQMKLDTRAASALVGDLKARAGAMTRERLAADDAARDTVINVYNLVNISVGAVLFIVPMNVQLDVPTIHELALAVNLMTGPVLFLTSQMYILLGATLAHDNLTLLERELDQGAAPAPGSMAGQAARPEVSFERIDVVGATFTYDGDEGGFTVGPLDLDIRRGEVLFITGGNGSGKTTMMKLLAGLYRPVKGRILLNGHSISAKDEPRYQLLFTAIFSDQHLFRKPYGLGAVDPDRVGALLQRFGLSDVTRFEGGRFTNIDLSSGQAKRLAMVIALLEDRPIFLLDEWAAHQDPELRRYYYLELIPELKARGKTILAVSHDARFFDLADRRVELKDGKLRVVETPLPAAADAVPAETYAPLKRSPAG